MDEMLFHPRLVHVPLALGVLMPLVTVGAVLAWWRRWISPRIWVFAVALQVVLVGSGILALRSGEAEEERVESVVAERFIEDHEEAAELFVWASGGVLGVMVLGLVFSRTRTGLTLAAAAMLLTLVVFALAYRTGEAGGSLVYRHGATQAYMDEIPAPGSKTAGRSEPESERD